MRVVTEEKIAQKVICGCQAIAEKVQMQRSQNFPVTKGKGILL